MFLPHICYQVSPRWLIVAKPSGWSLTPRSSNSSNSVTSYLASAIGNNPRLFFPVDVDTRMTALAIVCLDKGMHLQFERFQARREIVFKYQVPLNTPPISNISPDGLDVVISKPYSVNSGTSVELQSLGYLSAKKLSTLFQDNFSPEKVTIYGMQFPDPISTKSQPISVILPDFTIAHSVE